MTIIKIYGPGCKKCSELTDLTKQIVAELKLDCEIKKISDPMDMANDGVFATPSLAVDGKILVKGSVPSHAQLTEILQGSGIATGGCDCGGACAAPEEKAPAEPVEACGCGCACDEPQKAECAQAQSTGCGCGSGGCCGGGSGAGIVKQLILWIVLILVGVAIFKAVSDKKEDAAAAATATQPAIANGVEVVYYQFGARCVTCKRMEQWINEVVQQQFADELKSGAVVLKSVEAGADDVAKYALSTKSLIIKKIEGNNEKSWKNADKIWSHSRDEAAFKAYVAGEIKSLL